MRDQLVRSTFASVLLSVVIIAVPVGVAGWWAIADNALRLRGWLDQPNFSLQPIRLVAVMVTLSVVAVVAGVFMASLQARKFAGPMTQLADRAERLGAGESRFQPLVTGIVEVDRVSEVLARSAHQMTRSLASERDFASDASHQLRTPLTALLMRLEEISVTDDLLVVQEEAGIAIAQVERLTKVVDELRNMLLTVPGSTVVPAILGAASRVASAAPTPGARPVAPHAARRRISLKSSDTPPKNGSSEITHDAPTFGSTAGDFFLLQAVSQFQAFVFNLEGFFVSLVRVKRLNEARLTK